jgi:monosaccharide-transporting ATPase
MGFLPDDRKADGCIANLSVRKTSILALQARNGMFKTLPMSKQNELADKFIEHAADQDGFQRDAC